MRYHWVICVIVLLVASAGPAQQPAEPLTDQLPARTEVYLGWAGRSLSFDGSALGQLLQEPAVANLLSTLRDAIASDMGPDRPPKAIDAAWAAAGIAWQHPVAVAGWDVGHDGPGTFLLMIDLEQERDAFARHLSALTEALSERMTVRARGTNGKRSWEIDVPGGLRLRWSFQGRRFVLTTDPNLPDGGWAGEKSLASNPRFASAMAEVRGDNMQLAAFCDLQTLTSRHTDANQPVASSLARWGLDKASSFAAATRIVDRGMYSRARLRSSGPHRGLLAAVSGTALVAGDLADLPSDALYVSAVKLPPRQLMDHVRRFQQSLPGVDRRAVDRLLAEVAERTGVKVEEDIVEALGDTWVLASAPSLGGFATGTCLTVHVRDAQKLSAAVEKIKEWATRRWASMPPGRRPRWDVYRSGRAEIHYVSNLPGPMSMIAPAWTIHRDKLHLALWPQVLDAATRPRPGRGLIGEDGFRSVRARVSEKASLLTYMDTPRVLQGLYGPLMAGWSALAAASSREMDPPLKAHWLAALPTLSTYVWPDVSAVSSDAEGITWESYGSLPGMGSLHASTVVSSALLPALQNARRQAKIAISKSHLRGIGIAAATYAMDHDDTYPQGLGTLVNERLITADMIHSPLGRPGGPPDYTYVYYPKSVDPSAELILAYERPEHFGGRETLVLRVDGSVVTMDLPAFRKLLDRSLAAAQGQDDPPASDL